MNEDHKKKVADPGDRFANMIYQHRASMMFAGVLTAALSAFVHAAALPLAGITLILVTAVVAYWPREIPMDRGLIFVFGITVGLVFMSAITFGIESGQSGWLDICEDALRKHGR